MFCCWGLRFFLLRPNVKIGYSDALRSLIPTHQDTDMDKIQILSQIPTVTWLL